MHLHLRKPSGDKPCTASRVKQHSNAQCHASHLSTDAERHRGRASQPTASRGRRAPSHWCRVALTLFSNKRNIRFT